MDKRSAYFTRAEDLREANNLPEAFKFYGYYFDTFENVELCPGTARTNYLKTVEDLAAALDVNTNIEELMKIYLQAIRNIPKHPALLTEFALLMLKHKQYHITKNYLEEALKHNPNYLPAVKSLTHLKWNMFPRWHFRMLNDDKRNLAYCMAILGAIDCGYTNIVDIGAGCGLLSMYAHSSNNPNVRITALEANASVFKMLEAVTKLNDATTVTISNCHSTNYKVRDPFNLVITEIFDVALFGERAVETLLNAHQCLIAKDNFKIIPASAEVFVAGIACDEISGKFRYTSNFPSLNLTNKLCLTVEELDNEPYEAEMLRDKSVTYITDAHQLISVDFSDVNQLNDIENNPDFSRLVEIVAVQSGCIQVLAVWFSLNLWEGVRIGTDPRDDDSVPCWEQAIFHLKHPINVRIGQRIQIKATFADCKLKLKVVDDVASCARCFAVSPNVISFLNDDSLVNTVKKLADSIVDEKLVVMDFYEFPLLALLAAKKGMYAFCIYQSESDLRFFKYLMELNGIDEDKVVFAVKEVEDNLSILEKLVNGCDLHLVDFIKCDGTFKRLRLQNSIFSQSGSMPDKLIIHLAAISSEYLDSCNKVDDRNTRARIADVVNEYTGDEHPNLLNLDYIQLGETASLTLPELDEFEYNLPVKITTSGTMNGIYYWFDFVFSNTITYSTLDSSYYKKSCILLDKPKLVNIGDNITIKLEQRDNYLNISC